jgi:hypothetical protein
VNEVISIRKSSSGVMVNVTQKDGDNTVHWQERVSEGSLILRGGEKLVPNAIRACRAKCVRLWQGIADASEEED